ncbi:hypothetical protein GCM10007423_12140 [Dyadobacter endophyticus]|uniref:Uncharacterized protein n=2 Tax=Dyadobacter endophyticus TaxID=1749036 RepID=A0ABQ1YHV0_9BACT|nr:hypothetical protein GCM10007423_12140 [Dyadobacter endophyticus]
MFVAVDALAQTRAGGNDRPASIDWFGTRSRVVQADIDSSIRVREYSVVQIRQLLSKMLMVDQLYRDSLMSVPGTDKRYLAYAAKVQANDKANQAILAKIIAQMGWPKLSVVGMEGVNAAWIIVWHANRPYQDRYFPLIEKAYHSGEIPDTYFKTLERELAEAP